jgi:hypothetical protein
MNISFDNLSTKDRKTIEKLLENLLELFPFWVNDLEIDYDTDEVGGASIVVDRCYRRASIFVTKELLACSDSKIEKYLAHEVAHCYNEPIQRIVEDYLPLMIDDEKYLNLMSKIIEDALETQTEDLAILFLRDDNDNN